MSVLMERSGRRGLVRSTIMIVALLSVCGFGFGNLQDFATVSAGSSALLSIDADPTNGSGPCAPVDEEAAVDQGQAAIALCLENAGDAPVNGGLTSIQLAVAYGGPFQAIAAPSDLTTDLDGNPDWNQAVSPGGAAAWDCNVLNSSASAPRSTSPTMLVCNTNDLVNQPLDGTEHVATIQVQSTESGTSLVEWTGDTSLLSGFNEVLCGSGLTCIGASVSVGSGLVGGLPAPTATPLPELCGPGDPARWMHLALQDEAQIVALVSPLTVYEFEAGIGLRIDGVVEGSFAAKTSTADVENLLPCRPKELWSTGVPVVAVFLLGRPGGRADLRSVAGWPLTDTNGVLVGDRAMEQGTLGTADIRVRLDADTLVSVEELLELGRNYIAPTPTPLPPGVPPPPTVPAVDTGAGIALPSTGDGVAGGAPRTGSDGSTLLVVVGGTVAVIAALAGVNWAFSQGRRQR